MKKVLDFFNQISQIPRCSGNEKVLSDYLASFAKHRNLNYIQNELNNIIIRKTATSGYEHSPGIVIQGHLDMVCEKTPDSNHDFSKDPIPVKIEGSKMFAEDTTLGADNGIAIAMGLAILDSDDIKHPAIEVLLTVDEEVDMTGALELEDDLLEGKYLINLDSEEEGVLTVGSAGGVTIDASRILEFEESNLDFYEISFSGLKGGHSGMEINEPRGNMIKVINNFILSLKEDGQVQIGKFESGTVDNAIPLAGRVILALDEGAVEGLDETIKNTQEKYKDLDGNLEIEYMKTDSSKVWTSEIADQVSKALSLVKTGVNSMMDDKETVESSSNLAFIREEDGQLIIDVSIRSSNEDILSKFSRDIETTFLDSAFTVKRIQSYPSWEYKAESELRDIAAKTYEDMYKEKMEIVVIHAGLECGAIASKYPDMDMISVGPNLYNVHTVDEYLDLDSAERVYNYLIELLANIK